MELVHKFREVLDLMGDTQRLVFLSFVLGLSCFLLIISSLF